MRPLNVSATWLALVSVCPLILGGCGRSAPAVPPEAQEVRLPNPDVGADTLEARKRAQADTVKQLDRKSTRLNSSH